MSLRSKRGVLDLPEHAARLRTAGDGAHAGLQALALLCAAMEQRNFGRTGVKVSPLCLGAMMFGAWGNTDHDDSHPASSTGPRCRHQLRRHRRRVLARRVRGDRGQGAQRGRRDNVVLATKVHGKMGDDPNEFGNSRRWIIREVENSLRRLGTDWIDLYQIHRPEPDTDIDETLGALSDLVRAGQGPLRRLARRSRRARSSRRSGRPSGAAASAS